MAAPGPFDPSVVIWGHWSHLNELHRGGIKATTEAADREEGGLTSRMARGPGGTGSCSVGAWAAAVWSCQPRSPSLEEGLSRPWHPRSPMKAEEPGLPLCSSGRLESGRVPCWPWPLLGSCRCHSFGVAYSVWGRNDPLHRHRELKRSLRQQAARSPLSPRDGWEPACLANPLAVLPCLPVRVSVEGRAAQILLGACPLAHPGALSRSCGSSRSPGKLLHTCHPVLRALSMLRPRQPRFDRKQASEQTPRPRPWTSS